MKRKKLCAIREGHRRTITKRLENAAAEDTNMLTLETYLRAAETRMEVINDLDNKILESTEFEQIQEEIVTAEDFTVSVELKLKQL